MHLLRQSITEVASITAAVSLLLRSWWFDWQVQTQPGFNQLSQDGCMVGFPQKML